MTKPSQLIFNPLALVFLMAISVDAKAWRGLVPLHSTRVDVERVLGTSKAACRCIYKTETEVVTITYTRQRCSENPNGWNVPADTVVTITVAPVHPPKFSDLNIDERKFKKTKDLHTPAIYFSNNEEGIMYEVSDDGTVWLTVYGPSAGDSKLRCSQNTESDPTSFLPVFDQYGDISINDENARLDNFAAQLTHFSDYVGYIVVHSSREKLPAKAFARAQRARSYLQNVRDIKGNRLRIIKGDRRDRFTIELYIAPPTARPNAGIRRG